MDPSAAEILTFATLNDVATWAALPDAPRDEWWQHLGVRGDAHIRVIGGMSKADHAALTTTWQYQGVAPTPAQISQVGLIGRAVRVALKLELTVDEERAHTQQQAIAVAAAAAAPPVGVAAKSKQTVKISRTMNEVDDTEVEVENAVDFTNAYAAYVILGTYPFLYTKSSVV